MQAMAVCRFGGGHRPDAGWLGVLREYRGDSPCGPGGEAEGNRPPGLELVSGPPHPFFLHAPAGHGVDPAPSPTSATRPPPALPG